MLTRIPKVASHYLLIVSVIILPQAATAQQPGTVIPATEPALSGQDQTPEAAKPMTLEEAVGVQQDSNAPVGDGLPTTPSAEDVEIANADSLTPLQSRELVTQVSPVNLSMSEIGTGNLPEPPVDRFGDVVLLPDGDARGYSFQCVHWRASLVQHNPLYFQDVVLERHGHRCAGCLQPLVSGAKFYSTIAIYPYLRTLRCPQECQYALGNYRPGTPAPCLKQHLPYDKRAAAVQTLSAAAFFWAMPL